MDNHIFTRLTNGVRVLCEPMDRVRSASVGIWIDAGSRHEGEQEAGVAHFIEHMLFKGTARRDAYRLSVEQNLLGGNVNAYTSQEQICLSAKVADVHAERALDLLAEMLLESTFAEAELDRERNVILEEYKMYEDSPDEVVMDEFMSGLYAGHAIGRPILGTPKTLKAFRRDDLAKYAARQFNANNIVVSAAGRIEPERFVQQCTRLFSSVQPAQGPRPVEKPVAAYQQRSIERDLEQTHFVLGAIGPSRLDNDRFPFAILANALGGGPSSRIFQEVREKRGLAYSIGTFDWYFQDTGVLAVSGGTSPDTFEEVLDLCLKEVRRAGDELFGDEEIECARAQIRASLVLGFESTGSRMTRLAECELWHGRVISVDETLERVEAVTANDVRECARKWLVDKPITTAVIGPDLPKELPLKF